MITLLSECHFWTALDEIRIKSTDFGAFKYTPKRDLDSRAAGNDVTVQGKREYAEKRGGTVVLSNRKPTRLKDLLKRLEELLKVSKVVRCDWRDAAVAQLLFANGFLVHICVNIYTGDILKMAFDKYFIGKLAAETVTDAVFTRQHIVLAYNINQITVVFLQKPNMRRSGPEKIANMDPRIFHFLIPGPSERKLARNLIVNSSFDLIVIWTKSSLNEVYPWRPTIRDQDRANVHVFKLRAAKLESVAYCWTENDPICMEFLRSSDSQLITVEQKITRKGEITAEICSYEIGQSKMQRTGVTTIAIGTQICCYGFSPDQEKLVLGTIDRYVCIHDLVQKVTKFAPKTDIIATHCAWHPDSGVVMISNDRSQFQCLDLSLSFVANQIISEDVTPSNLHDLSHYFAMQPTLLKTSFSCKADLNNFAEHYAQTDCFLLLIFENGPIGCIRFLSGTGMAGDVHNSGLTPDVLVGKYLAIGQMERAVNILLALNWETYGAMCLIALHNIANFVFTRNETKRSRNELLKRALQSFTDVLSDETKDEFSDQLIDLKRRYFFFLLRNRLYIEAFEIGQKIEDYDLLMDLFNVTKSNEKFYSLAGVAYRQAESILNQNDSTTATVSNATPGDTNSVSSCSHSSCSECMTQQQSTVKGETKRTAHNISSSTAAATLSGTKQSLIVKRFQKNRQDSESHLKTYMPPLQYSKSKVFSAENIKINIPKPELRSNSNSDIQGNYIKATHRADLKRSHRRLDNSLAFNSSATIAVANSVNFRGEPLYSEQSHFNNVTGYSTVDGIPSQLHPVGSNATGMWSKIPDQTLGIPLAATASSAVIPFASKSLNSMLSASYGIFPPPQPRPSNLFQPLHIPQPPVSHEFTNNNFSPLLKSESLYNLPKFYQHPLVSGKIPSAVGPEQQPLAQSTDDLIYRNKKPAVSILANSGGVIGNVLNNSVPGAVAGVAATAAGVHNSPLSKKDSGEKNKVKFSDTVQVAVVPEISRKEKPLPPKRNGFRTLLTNPQKELADSLPLCHPNDEYLKDFNPITETSSTTESAIVDSEVNGNNTRNASTIKVVHFGVV